MSEFSIDDLQQYQFSPDLDFLAHKVEKELPEVKLLEISGEVLCKAIQQAAKEKKMAKMAILFGNIATTCPGGTFRSSLLHSLLEKKGYPQLTKYGHNGLAVDNLAKEIPSCNLSADGVITLLRRENLNTLIMCLNPHTNENDVIIGLLTALQALQAKSTHPIKLTVLVAHGDEKEFWQWVNQAER